MKPFKVTVGLVLAISVGVPLWIQHRAKVNLHDKSESVRRQAGLLAELSAENAHLSKVVAQAKSTNTLSDAQLTELMKLRDEVGPLRRSLKETDALQREIRRLQEGLTDPAMKKETSGTTLLAEEMELRRTRVDQLKRWLETRPEEKIPELEFLSEDSWIRSADRQRFTDEEFRGWMSAQRSNAEGKFAHLAFKALKQYAEANDGHFPTDLSQLKPYFQSAIDDAILERYEIVPAKSLIKFLAEADREWVITQKAPINKSDTRVAIGLSDCRGTLEEGRWDRPGK